MATRSGLADCSDWVDVIVVYLRLDYGERRRRGASAVRGIRRAQSPQAPKSIGSIGAVSVDGPGRRIKDDGGPFC
jgi:hypothetical protein